MQKRPLPTRRAGQAVAAPGTDGRKPTSGGDGQPPRQTSRPPQRPSRWTGGMGRVRALAGQSLPVPARLGLMAVGVVGLLVAIVVSALSLMQGAELRQLEQHSYDKSSEDLGTRLIAQSFRSTHANLSRVDLQVSSFSGLPSTGVFNLVQGDGPVGPSVYRGSLADASFAGNPFLAFRFPPIADSQDVTYTLVLSMPGTLLNSASAFALSYSSFDVLSMGRMYTDEGPQRGDLVISTYYRYGAKDALGDAVHAVTVGLGPFVVLVLLLMLPGLALLVWLPGRLEPGQRVLTAPGVTVLTLPVFFLVTRAVGIPMGGASMWVVLAICLAMVIGAAARGGRRLKVSRPDIATVGFWSLLGLVLAGTLVVRMLAVRDLPAGLGLDAYHHTLIAQMFVQQGGVPTNYLPFAPLASFTYHFGFHDLIASVAWLSGATSPVDMMKLMPQAGQIATALPVVTLTVFGWKVLGNRWAGLLAGALAGLLCIFPAYYVNWSRYAQALGLALLPVSLLLYLEVVQRPVRPRAAKGDAAQTGAMTWQSAIRQSGPYLLGVIGAAGLFLTHYRIAIVYAAFVGLYLAGRLVADLRRRAAPREVAAPFRRTMLLAVLTLAALSPWLVNLAQNFRSHLVGRDTPTAPDYYDLTPLKGLLTDWTLLLMLGLAVVGMLLAVRARQWLLLAAALVWVPLALWSNPYLLDGVLPGFRLPYSGYLDVTTVAQSVWLPFAMLGGYALAQVAAWFLSLGKMWPAGRLRLWQTVVAVLMGIVVLGAGLAAAVPVAANLDKKPYVADADEQALVWMRDNLPRNAYVLANPFAFGWAPGNVYGSDSGMWVPLVAGVGASVPPLPAYNEKLADPEYTNKVLDVIKYEPFTCYDPDPQKCGQPDWDALKSAGITDIYVGSRGGALDIPTLLASDHTRLLYHQDGAFVFELR